MDEILKRHTIECSYNVDTEGWRYVSSAAKDLIRKLLINREERLTAADALGHRWFREGESSILSLELSSMCTAS